MTLNQEIRDMVAGFKETFPADLNALIEQGAGEISVMDIISNAKRVGDDAPDAQLTNSKGEQVNFLAPLERGSLVVTFYRGAWCPYCNLQLKTYSDNLADIDALGATLVAVTPEKPNGLEILSETGASQALVDGAVKDVGFEILHDAENKLAKAFGIVFDLPESHRQLMTMLNVDIEALNGDDSFTFPDPATFVIAPSGKITWAFVPNNYRRRAEVGDILDALKTLNASN